MERDKKGYFTIQLRIDRVTAELIQKLKEDTGLSIREIVGYSDKACECCKNISIVAFNSKDKTVKIPRGILFQALQRKNSTYEKSPRDSKDPK